MTLVARVGEIPTLRVGDFIVINGDRLRLVQATWRPMSEEERVDWPDAGDNALVAQWEMQPAPLRNSAETASFEEQFGDPATAFRKVVWSIYCAHCHVEIAGEDWPSHYRTRTHREACRRGD